MASKKSPPAPDPEKLSEAALSQAALSYLNRSDATVTQLRQVLLRRLTRYGTSADAEVVKERIEVLLQRFVDSRLLDDRRFAEGFVRSARGRGLSTLKVRQKLRQRGVEAEVLDDSLRALEVHDELTELGAARTFVRKKRLLTRYDLKSPAEKQKALAALARQGYSLRVALEALGAELEGDELDGDPL